MENRFGINQTVFGADISVSLRMEKIYLSNYKNIVILTGAGISVTAGLKPFLGANGMWNEPKAQQASLLSFSESPNQVWSFWSQLRPSITKAMPTAAHIHLNNLEKQLHKDIQFLLVTQNIDGLHQKAGSVNTIELHGNLLKTKCVQENCSFQPIINDASVHEVATICPICGNYLRPDVVLFGEFLSLKAHIVKRALRSCDLFISIGTSGSVSPASNFVRSAEYAGARTIYMNLTDINPPNPYYQQSYLGEADNLVTKYLMV